MLSDRSDILKHWKLTDQAPFCSGVQATNGMRSLGMALTIQST